MLLKRWLLIVTLMGLLILSLAGCQTQSSKETSNTVSPLTVPPPSSEHPMSLPPSSPNQTSMTEDPPIRTYTTWVATGTRATTK